MSGSISIALGGSDVDGLIGWGVLHRLLEEEDVEIAAISASGSGCFSATAVAQGLLRKGRQGAIERLDSMWREIVSSWNKSVADPDPWQMLMPLLATAEQADATLTGEPYFFSPEDINPLDFNPLWDIAEGFLPEPGREMIPVFLTALNVNSGRKRVFNSGELTHDLVRAATCAPWRNAAVEIDGDFFWGTNVSAPSLFPLFDPSLPQDIFCVIPAISNEKKRPGSGEAIASRLAALTAFSALGSELRSIDFAKRLLATGAVPNTSFRELFVHGSVVAPPDKIWPETSTLYRDPAISDDLYWRGYRSAAAWLADNKDRIGRMDTLDIRSLL